MPLALELAFIIYASTQVTADNPGMWQLILGAVMHILIFLWALLFYHAFLHFATHAIQDGNAGIFVGLFAAWLGLLAVLWVGTFLVMQAIPGPRSNPVVTDRAHNLRLFDDGTLFANPSPNSPTLADQFYPSGARKMLKLWWEGDATPPMVRSDRDRITFRFPGGLPANDQVVFAPFAGTRPSEFAALLTRTINDSGGNATQRLHAVVAYTDAVNPPAADPVREDYDLPPGDVFAFHDEEPAGGNSDSPDADGFRLLKATQDDAVILFHAPKVRQSVRFGRDGAISMEDRTANDTTPAGQLTSMPAVGALPRVAIQRSAGADSLFAIFRPGDLVNTTGGGPDAGQTRVVVSVDANDQLTVCCPFVTPLAGTTYQRTGRDARTTPAAPMAGTITNGPGAFDITGAGTSFGSIFRPGDLIRVGAAADIAPGPLADGVLSKVQERRVISVTSDTVLVLDQPLSPPPVAPNDTFVRVGDDEAQGLSYVGRVAPGDDNIFTGETVLNHAADLAALLCMGAASHILIDPTQPDATAVPDATFPLKKVYQVFRNWNLDRRRENEWKMIVTGGAVSEKRGDVAAADPAVPPTHATWSMLAPKGEPTANSLGWLPLFRRWLDMARRPGTDTSAQTSFRADDPNNLALSRGMSFLFDMREPDQTAD